MLVQLKLPIAGMGN